jgi:hypothetical protein
MTKPMVFEEQHGNALILHHRYAPSVRSLMLHRFSSHRRTVMRAGADVPPISLGISGTDSRPPIDLREFAADDDL